MAHPCFVLSNELLHLIFLYIGPKSTVSFSATNTKAASLAPFEGGRFTQKYKDALVSNLHAKFRKSGRFCKCGCLLHRANCPLATFIYDQPRWPGCDGYISWEEMLFLRSLKKNKPHWFAVAERSLQDMTLEEVSEEERSERLMLLALGSPSAYRPLLVRRRRWSR